MIKKGFTLAEMLITLGIIGVVAAMTIPSLVTNYQKQAYVAGLQKVYSEVLQALERYETDQHVEDLYETSIRGTNGVGEFMKSYLKVAEDCGSHNTGRANCYGDFASGYPKFNNSAKKVAVPNIGFYHVKLASGAILSMGGYSNQPLFSANMYVDVNGPKGPNKAGRDFFALIYSSGTSGVRITDYNGKMDTSYFNSYCNSSSSESVLGCFGKIFSDGWKMNY